MPKVTPPPNRLHTLWAAAVLAACGLAAYGSALRNPFIIDDKFIILGDPRVQTADVRAIFTEEYWPGSVGNRLYRPLVLLSFAANWAVSHQPWTFRLVNLLLHVAGGLALFLLARELTGRVAVALGAALLFVLHPVHTMPLNQIVDRADLAAAAGVLWAAWLYRRDGNEVGQHGWVRPAVAAVIFALALLCKENAVTLVGIVLVLDLARPRGARAAAAGAQPGRHTWPSRRLVRCYVPIVMVTLAYLAVRQQVLGQVAREAGAISPLDNIIARPEYGLQPGDSLVLARWGTPLAVFGRAARLLVWPYPLSWDYSYAAIDSVRRWSDPRLWWGVATLAVCAAILAVSWRRERVAFAGLGLALAAYSVVSNTFVVIGGVFAERYLYLPSAGFCLLVARLVQRAAAEGARRSQPMRSVWRSAIGGAAGMACLACLGATVARNRDFASPAGLNKADLKVQPRSSRLWTSVAGDALLAGDHAVALQHAQQALAIYPENPTAWCVAGLAYWRMGQPDQALEHLRRSFDYGGGNNENAWVAIGDILTSRGSYAQAIAALGEFVGRQPRAATAQNNLAWYLLTAEPATLRDPQRALGHAEQAVKLQPTIGDFVDTYYLALVTVGRSEEAKRMLAEALPRISPHDPQRAALARKLQER